MPKSNSGISAFTTKYNGIANLLSTQIWVAEAFDSSNQTIKPNLIEYKCIWDTGATNSVISPKIVADLGLQPTGKKVCFTAGGQKEMDTYLVAIKLPNGVGFPSVNVTEAKVQGFDALIGMDIISGGDFAVTAENGKTILSYQYPSAKTIDFVEQIKKKNPTSPILNPDQKRKARNRRKKDRKKGK